MLKLRRYLLLLLILLCLVILFQNKGTVEVKLLFWGWQPSKVILFFLLLLTGFVLGWLSHLLHLRKKGKA